MTNTIAIINTMTAEQGTSTIAPTNMPKMPDAAEMPIEHSMILRKRV
jgi:hypothetical protein